MLRLKFMHQNVKFAFHFKLLMKKEMSTKHQLARECKHRMEVFCAFTSNVCKGMQCCYYCYGACLSDAGGKRL